MAKRVRWWFRVLAVACTVAAGLVAGAVARPVPAHASVGSGLAPGYWVASSDGRVYQFSTTNFGDLAGLRLAAPIVGGAATPDGVGYWMAGADGGVFSFGDAVYRGSMGGIRLAQPVVGMAADPATGGYWLVAADGGVFSFGAPFFGSAASLHLAKPVVGMVATPDGRGYWLVAADGGVFTYGDAGFFGSAGGLPLAKPVVGMAATPDGQGYWLAAADGGVFTYGDAGFHGSAASLPLAAPVVGIGATPDGQGYWLGAADGGVFTFGTAPFLGTPMRPPGSAPVVALLTTPHGYPFPPGATGYDVSLYQCPVNGGTLPGPPHAVSVVQVSGGAINADPNPCYTEEAVWAGPNLAAYIFLNPLPSPAPPESASGPAGACGANAWCQNYNFGWYWARHWVGYSRTAGFSPNLWWLDVETSANWNLSPAAQPLNSALISGAVAGLRSMGVAAGIYSTNLQWNEITGGAPTFPHIPLWIPGAEGMASGPYNAVSFCTEPAPDYAPFAGGTTVLVQYGYGSNYPYDQDFACPLGSG